MKILIVEDEPSLRELIQRSLEKERYVVEAAGDFNSALRKIEDYDYDCILLDIMLPDGSGLDLLERLKALHKRENVIIISAKDSLEDKVLGLELGADDYLPKPFSTSELLARVRAMLRRKDNYVPDLLTYNDVVLNRSTYELGYDNKTQTLSGKEFQIAEMMMQQPNSIIATEQFITHIWGWDSHVDTSVVWVHISNLRKKIDAVNAPIEIRFVRNAGYILEDKQ